LYSVPSVGRQARRGQPLIDECAMVKCEDRDRINGWQASNFPFLTTQ
jgi:hypothetical protein